MRMIEYNQKDRIELEGKDRIRKKGQKLEGKDRIRRKGQNEKERMELEGNDRMRINVSHLLLRAILKVLEEK